MDKELDQIKSQQIKVTYNSCNLPCTHVNENNKASNNFVVEASKKVEIPPPIAEVKEVCQESFSTESCKTDNYKVDRIEILQFLLSGRSSYELVDSDE